MLLIGFVCKTYASRKLSSVPCGIPADEALNIMITALQTRLHNPHIGVAKEGGLRERMDL